MTLKLLRPPLAICRLDSSDLIPDWALQSPFFSISKTADELSIVCLKKNVPDGIKAERDWHAIQVKGPLDFGLTGILASIAKPLADASVSIFSLSTFDTDYILVKSDKLNFAMKVLTDAGHIFID
jgi:hypothetical protein